MGRWRVCLCTRQRVTEEREWADAAGRQVEAPREVHDVVCNVCEREGRGKRLSF